MYALKIVKKQLPLFTLSNTQTEISNTGEQFEGKFIFVLKFQGKPVIEFFATHSNECQVFANDAGIFYCLPGIIGFYSKRRHFKLKRAKNLAYAWYRNSLYFIDDKGILKVKNSHMNKQGNHPLPVSRVASVKNFSEFLESLDLSGEITIAKWEGAWFLQLPQKLLIIKEGRVLQLLWLYEEIRAIRQDSEGVYLQGTQNWFKIIPQEAKVFKRDFPMNEPMIVAELRTEAALERTSEIKEIVDLLWFDKYRKDVESVLTAMWHLDPLDRVFLSSEEFYSECLYTYLEELLPLSVLYFYMQAPDKLILLREALREQQERLYANGHLEPDEPLSSLITRYLPPKLPNESQEQAQIRQMMK
mmetsp:Transcript_32959/g.57865  ORF Transcript_32959/g.57865 Transcript_32959/m.57865 type:complete len:359 (-) Transcript_32959:6-1082(-)